jgi:hypothetical protein
LRFAEHGGGFGHGWQEEESKETEEEKMLADQFSQLFRAEHREIRDALLDLVAAFQARDRERIGALLGAVASFAGPHFRYEEEALYPALVEIFGSEYVAELLRAHDGAIAGARRLVELSRRGTLADAEVEEAVQIIRKVLPHVSDCDGLSIMVERLPEPKVRSILAARDVSRADGLSLFEWAEQVRERRGATA